jgi:hypothetical protein
LARTNSPRPPRSPESRCPAAPPPPLEPEAVEPEAVEPEAVEPEAGEPDAVPDVDAPAPVVPDDEPVLACIPCCKHPVAVIAWLSLSPPPACPRLPALLPDCAMRPAVAQTPAKAASEPMNRRFIVVSSNTHVIAMAESPCVPVLT